MPPTPPTPDEELAAWVIERLTHDLTVLGLLGPAQETFEVLWSARQTVTLAHRPLVTLVRPAALAVGATYSLRSVLT